MFEKKNKIGDGNAMRDSSSGAIPHEEYLPRKDDHSPSNEVQTVEPKEINSALNAPTALMSAALAYASRGWSVLPLHSPVPLADGSASCSCGKDDCKSIGKHPRTKNGLKEATTDKKIIERWLSQWPGSNIGIATGEKSGFFVLDVDMHDADGEATLAELTKKYGPLPETLESVTGGGGRHLLFRTSSMPRNSSGKVGSGLDVRGDGGYMVAPPSIHKSGKLYEWKHVDAEISDAPQWLLSLANVKPKKNAAKQSEDSLEAVIPQGQRNETLTSIGGKLRSNGVEQTEIEARLLEINKSQCKPPLDEREVKAISASVSKYEPSAKATATLRVGKYFESKGWTYFLKETRDDEVAIWLSNFTARIVGDVEEDDGSGELTRYYKIIMKMGASEKSIKVPMMKYLSCIWAQELFGAAARINPMYSSVPKLADAIQAFSNDQRTIKLERHYKHTGWVKIEGKSYYLHSGGAIGEKGLRQDVSVKMPYGLNSYSLPTPPIGVELLDSVKSFLNIWEVTPGSAVGYILAASIGRAVLGQCDTSVFITGHTGSYKSEMAALGLSAFGQIFSARSLPASFSDTDNAIGAKAFHTKDAILVVDDYVPQSGGKSIIDLNRKADRLFRGAGNRQGRGRLDSNAELRPDKPPRCFVLATGEEVPQGHSLNARLFIVDMKASEVNLDALTKCQIAAKSGLYAKATSGLLKWLASSGRIEAEKKKINLIIEEVRLKFKDKGHARQPDNLAQLIVGLNLIADFAQSIGIKDAAKWKDRGRVFLEWAAQSQNEWLSQAGPVQIFLTNLSAALESGQCHLDSRNGQVPKEWRNYGWKEADSGGLNGVRYTACGDRIGFIDETAEKIFLIREASMAKAKKMAEGANESFQISQRRLGEALLQKGLLQRDGSHYAAKISINNQRERFWVMPISAFNWQKKELAAYNEPASEKERENYPHDDNIVTLRAGVYYE